MSVTTLQVQQYGSMKDDFRGAFEVAETGWSWGQWDSGEFWAECIEVFGDDESLYQASFEAASIKDLFTTIASEVGTTWFSVKISDDWGKTKTIKL